MIFQSSKLAALLLVVVAYLAPTAAADSLRGLSSLVDTPAVCPGQTGRCSLGAYTDGLFIDLSTSLVHIDSQNLCQSKCVAASSLTHHLNNGYKCGDCSGKWTEESICEVDDDNNKLRFYRIKRNGKCEVKCKDGDKMDQLKAKGYTPNSCFPSCPKSNRCDLDDEEVKFTLYRTKDDGDCESECTEEKDLEDYFDEGYSCQRCGSSNAADLPEIFPAPDKCVMTPSSRMLKYEPEFADVNIQVQIIDTDEILTFFPGDGNGHDGIDIQSMQMYRKLSRATKGGGFRLRYISSEGIGGWSTCKYSPIALDLDHSGAVERISGNFQIDLIGDGNLEYLNEWFAPTEGILIDSFATDDSANHGFDKLLAHDYNRGGYVNSMEFWSLMVWTDANSNCKVDPGETKLLSEYGIDSLDTTSHDGRIVSSGLVANGTPVLIQDLW